MTPTAARRRSASRSTCSRPTTSSRSSSAVRSTSRPGEEATVLDLAALTTDPDPEDKGKHEYSLVGRRGQGDQRADRRRQAPGRGLLEREEGRGDDADAADHRRRDRTRGGLGPRAGHRIEPRDARREHRHDRGSRSGQDRHGARARERLQPLPGDAAEARVGERRDRRRARERRGRRRRGDAVRRLRRHAGRAGTRSRTPPRIPTARRPVRSCSRCRAFPRRRVRRR